MREAETVESQEKNLKVLPLGRLKELAGNGEVGWKIK